MLNLQFSKKKKKVFIFGTGAGGKYLFDSIQSQYKVLGFLDNNSNKHGTRFCGKPVFDPKEIGEKMFDTIIIASDSYKEIHKQLTGELSVPEHKISLYHDVSLSPRHHYKHHLISALTNYICNHKNLLSSCLLYLVKLFVIDFRCYLTNDILWLDQLEMNKVKEFIAKHKGFSFTPNFLDSKSQIKQIYLPSVSAYFFKQATISPTNSAISFDNNTTVMTRVPSLRDHCADYSGGNIVTHGSNKVILRKGKPKQIQRGIAITGSSDTNYYHWVLEVLSKLQYLSKLPCEFVNFPILISKNVQEIPSISSFFSLFKIKNDVIWLESTSQYQVNELIYITPPNYIAPNLKIGEVCDATNCYISSSSLRFLKLVALKGRAKKTNESQQKRVFFARKPYIRSFNQDEVISILDKYGFKPVYLEDLTFEEQVEVMQQAEIIIGPTGAAWTNLIFANSGIRCLTWIAEEAGDFSGYSSLAEHLGIKLDFITYKAGTADTRGMYIAPYDINCEKIEKWVVNTLARLD
ncbi:DUF563 domain-containing protein [Alteromonas sp. 5E99-2]|uniref:glycosyltransferase family 61 protein n=1 Tax=Alteromonas sp. 5E99-2 TaxID=2817683 RepID=UPI001A99A9D8|nr:glycosyltransferase family 61 protein [Alteromonas sp. 5E99-2]MBO1255250.1 DUF563 domain-containing protein [Alteromonas sp. 5E99-2]